MMGQLLSWYPRKHAFQTAFDLIRGRTHQVQESLPERIQHCRSWLTTQAFERVAAASKYTYKQVHPSLSTQMTYQSIKQEINVNTDLDTNLLAHAFLPNNVLLLHPYGDRSLIEFCLGLAPHHRAGFAAGQRVSKLLLRLAYLGDLPSSIIGREVRLPYASVQPYYCLNNQVELQTVLDPDSCLAQLGIIDPPQMVSILTDMTVLMEHCGSLVSAAAVELWLRHMTGVPLDLPKTASSGRRRSWSPSVDRNAKQRNGMLTFPTTILTKEVNGFLVLINESTQDVIELSQEASLLLAILQSAPSWSAALVELRHQWEDEQEGEAEIDEQGIREFVSVLLYEEAWARWRTIDCLALERKCEAVVAEQPAFLQWAMQSLPLEHCLFVLNDATQAVCWNVVGKQQEWFRLFEQLMAAVPPTHRNREDRFLCMRISRLQTRHARYVRRIGVQAQHGRDQLYQ